MLEPPKNFKSTIASNKMKKTTTLIAASALSLSMLFSGCERPKAPGMEPPAPGPVNATFATVKASSLDATMEATGQTQAFNTVQIYSRVNGYLQKRAYKEGAKVSAGDTLFVIDPSDLTNAKNSAEASLKQAEAAFENAKATLARVKPLYEANAASRQEYDNAVASERSTAASLSAAKAALSQANLNLSYAYIKTPIGGFADKSKADVGTFIQAGANGLLTTVYQTNPIYVNFSFSENQKLFFKNAVESGRLLEPKDGKYEAVITLGDGATVNKKGSISFTAPFFDTATGVMSYRATFDNEDTRLLPGQFVRVSINGLKWQNSVSVPQKAVLTNEKGKFVYVYEQNNTVSPRPIEIGAWSGGNVIVQKGLKEGEKIAIDALSKLKPGAPVKPAFLP